MKRILLAAGLFAVAAIMVPDANAQHCEGCESGAIQGGGGLLHGRIGGRRSFSGGGVYNDQGMVVPDEFAGRAPGHVQRLRYSHQDHFGPNPHFAYSRNGLESGYTYEWNKQQMVTNPWHDSYDYWRFGGPTALVVPATASFQSHYGWGVGQTKSNPIYHQFGYGNGGGGILGGGGNNPAPYWPYSTDQYGVYPVRAPH